MTGPGARRSLYLIIPAARQAAATFSKIAGIITEAIILVIPLECPKLNAAPPLPREFRLLTANDATSTSEIPLSFLLLSPVFVSRFFRSFKAILVLSSEPLLHLPTM